MITAIVNGRVFDGIHVVDGRTVVVDGARIADLPKAAPAGTHRVDAAGGTVLPGLIDAHVHTDLAGLRQALRFGVTTQLDMNGRWTAEQRAEIDVDDDVADLRCAGFAVTAPGGHPAELFDAGSTSAAPPGLGVTSTPEAARLVAGLVAGGADYVKVMIEDGALLGRPGLSVLADDVLRAAVRAAHAHGRLTVAHALTEQTARRALDAGVDGLAHVFIDRRVDHTVLASMLDSKAFAISTLAAARSIVGLTARGFAADDRVTARLPRRAISALGQSINTFPGGNAADALENVGTLHRAGIDVLAGTDASGVLLSGLANGASLHHELQLLVDAGLSPTAALRAATAVPARRFGLTDRGRIAPGLRADLVLVDGDPTTDITDTLSLRHVWRCGALLR
ncbi:amidohydrolase family protein [Asanoa siamensis]|uniref:Imidazolonepropionase n=1 Tax=Asanoa siamensis TaxID=926357 RepID=A0ABQ4D4G6_9ACTN|nr:amidohydrolase family protein [Asanoa siamensis]GIF78007.1 imidazolonepropionase [Asanoa siamensis]